MTASKELKQHGINDMAELSSISHAPRRTLYHWRKTNPNFYACILRGAAIIKQEQEAASCTQ